MCVPDAQPTVSKHWRQTIETEYLSCIINWWYITSTFVRLAKGQVVTEQTPNVRCYTMRWSWRCCCTSTSSSGWDVSGRRWANAILLDGRFTRPHGRHWFHIWSNNIRLVDRVRGLHKANDIKYTATIDSTMSMTSYDTRIIRLHIMSILGVAWWRSG